MNVPRAPTGLPAAGWKYLRTLREQSNHEARRFLTDSISQLVERYRAASAWLFVYSPDRPVAVGLDAEKDPFPLKYVVGHNAPSQPAMAINGTIAGGCVETGNYMVYPLIRQAYGIACHDSFDLLKTNTRSAMAIPVFGALDQQPKDIIGVFVLESHEPYTFSILDAEEATAEAGLLAPALLFVKRYLSYALSECIWFPPLCDWNVTRVLNDFCYTVSTEVSNAAHAAPFGMTIWICDEEEGDNRAFAIGAARFDSEYLDQRYIPTYMKSQDEPIPLSFVGSLLLHSSTTAMRPEWRGLFRRPAKLARMEVEEIYGVPLHKFDVGATSSDSLQNRVGALTAYAYSGTANSLKHELEGDNFSRLASIVGRFLKATADIVPEFAAALLYGRLYADAITGINTFNIIRDVLMQVLDLDGCSIFVTEMPAKPSLGSVVLKCVTTSGLIAPDGRELATQDAEYRIGKAGHSRHKTVQMLIRPGTAERFNDRSPVDRSKLGTARRQLETFTLLEYEHKRMMLYSFGLPPEESRLADEDGLPLSYGVIRAVRSTRKRRFTKDDEKLVAKLREMCEIACRLRSEQNHKLDAYPLRKDVITPTQAQQLELDVVYEWGLKAIKRVLSQEEIRTETELKTREEESIVALERVTRRMFSDVACVARWSRRKIESILQDLFFALRTEDPNIAMLRFVETDRNSELALSVHSFHAGVFVSGLEEGAGDPIREVEGGIGWEAIKQMRVIQFKSTDPRFRHLFPQLENDSLSTGICIPVVLGFPKWPVMGALSTTWPGSTSLKLQREIAILLFVAAWRVSRCSLSALCLNQSKSIDSPVSPSDFATFAGMLLKECAIPQPSAYCLCLFSDGVKDQLIGRSDKWLKQDSVVAKRMYEDHLTYDPKRISDRFTRSDAIDMRTHSTEHHRERAFGRSDTTAVDILTSLSLFGVRIDSTSGYFVVPLPSSSAHCGWLAGRYGVSGQPNPFSKIEDVQHMLRIVLQGLLALIPRWMHYNASWTTYFGDQRVFLRQTSPGEYESRCHIQSQGFEIS